VLFRSGTWEGVVAFAEENGKTHKYYKPTEQSTDAYLAAIQLAVEGGAKIIVTPGFLFEEPIYLAQDLYEDVYFVLIDGNPHNADSTEFRTEENAVGILFAEEQSGYLAGYAAVKDGYTKLGFMGGMAVPAVVRFGYGFVQGAEAAAAELGIPSIDMNITIPETSKLLLKIRLRRHPGMRKARKSSLHAAAPSATQSCPPLKPLAPRSSAST
jgi:basic membrane protein A